MMRNTVLNYIDRFRHDRRERLVFGFVLLFLAVIVSLSVYWQLRYTGITMTNVTYCGYEEHIHTDECYEKTLICGLEETEGHTHSEECYDEEGNLICGLEEREGHTHTDECYEYTLICGLEEHTHTAECLIDLTADVEDSSIWEATLPVTTGDIRTNIVNIATSQLGYTESVANYSVAEDGVTHMGYTRYGAWYGNEYGSWDAMFAAFCLHYAGIDESEFPVNSGALAWSVQLKELGRYADAADYTPSTGDIVFFDSDSDGRIDRVGVVTAVDESAGMVTIIEGDYTSGEVDTVCQHIYPLSNTTIVGFGIIPVADETDTTIYNADTTTDETTDTTTDESTDSSEEVTEDDEEVIIDEEETEDSSEEVEDTETETESVFTASDSGVTVTVTAPAGALPENAVLSVTLIDEESEEYAAAAEAVGYDTTEAESAINAISEDDDTDTEETEDEISTALAVLDISFTVDGVTVEPSEAVTVSIDASSLLTDDADASTLEVQHLEETAEGITPVLVADATDDTEGTVDAETAVVEFTTESFSTYTLYWYTHSTMGWGSTDYGAIITVNIYTSDDGSTYSSSTLDSFTDSFTTTTSGNNRTFTLSVDDLVGAVSGLDDYDFAYATMYYNYDGNTYGSSTDSLTSVSSTYRSQQNWTTTYYYTPTYYTESNTSGTTLTATTTTTERTNISYFTINLYYAKSSASLTVYKYETDTTTQLTGATFTLTSDASLADVDIDDSYDSRSDYSITFTTTNSEITFSDLPDGTYTLTETTAPDGYDTADSFSFTVEDNTITTTDSRYDSEAVTIEDDPSTVEITLAKVYTDASGNEITTSDSSVFTLTEGTTQYNSSIDDQTVTFSGADSGTLTCRYGSTYILTESTAPDGYEDIGDITITVDTSGNITVSGNATLSGTTLTVTNKAYTELTVSKAYKAADGSNKKTADVKDLTAEFTITASDGTEYTDSISGKGTLTFSLPDGTYTITESDIPDGYFASDDVTFTVDSGVVYVDGVATAQNTITFTNTEKTTLTITKVYVNSSGSKVTTGIDSLEATFTITDGTNTYSGTITGAGEYVFEGDEALADGTYTLSETAAGGYVAVDDVTVTISGGEISIDTVDNVSLSDDTITVTNEPDENHSLAGMSYAIANLDNNNGNEYAMMASVNSSGGLDGLEVEEVSTTDGIALIKGDATVWTFEAADGDNNYYIYTTINGTKYYLNVTANNQSGVTISTSEQILTVKTDDSTGKVRITNTDDTVAVNWYGGSNSSNLVFGGYYGNDKNEWLTLCQIYEDNGLTIIDNLVTDGEYEAHLVIDNVAVDLTDSRYTVTWYRSDYEFDSSYNAVNLEVYSPVENADALGDNNTTVNVAIDGGGLCYYYVEVYDSVTGETYSTLTYQVEHVPYAAELMNCSFEYLVTSGNSSQVDSSYVPFWNTTATDSLIEIGKYSASSTTYGTNTSSSGGADTGIYAGGSQAAAGDQFAELNADQASTLYQSVLTIGGESLNWAFYHRARTAQGGGSTFDATDTMYIVLMSEDDAQKVFEYATESNTAQQTVLTNMISNMTVTGTSNTTNASDYKEGTYTFTLDGESVTVSLSVWTLKTETDADGDWTYYYGSYEVPDEQYVTRFFFVSGSTSTGNSTVGNLIDYATFSQNISYVIEYWTRDQNSGEYTLVETTTGSEYPYTNVYADISSYVSAGYGLVGSVTGTASGGSYPMDYKAGGTITSAYTSMFDQYTTTGMRINSGTMYLSVYLSMPVVTVIKQVSGLSESQLDTVLDEGDYEVDFTIYDSSGNVASTLTVHIGSTGIGSSYTTDLVVGETYTIVETVNYDGTYLDDYEMTVTVSGAQTTNALGSYTFTVEKEESITITFTNTYAEVTTGGPEMPQTGGGGTKLYAMVGILLICSASYLLYILKQQRQLKQQKRKCKWRWNI